jgi:hypothetical protein
MKTMILIQFTNTLVNINLKLFHAFDFNQG